ncbi:hypothetical protein N9B82_05980, partial [Saprospiraceae bacterium]|nr:hypothetical protein [Saprospiraceae bacterium]
TSRTQVISTLVFLVLIYLFSYQIIHLKTNYHNLLLEDLTHVRLNIATSAIAILASVGMYFQNKLGWLIVCLYIVMQMFSCLFLEFDTVSSIVYLVILTALLILLQLRSIREFYSFKIPGLISLVAFGCVLTFLQFQVKADYPSRISTYYLYENNDGQGMYDDSLYTGEVFFKNQEGIVILEGHLEKGWNSGKWTYYSDLGSKSEVLHFEKGVQQGEYKKWFIGYDKLEIIGQYKDDMKAGIWKKYEIDSYEVLISTYENGEEIDFKVINIEGQLDQE